MKLLGPTFFIVWNLDIIQRPNPDTFSKLRQSNPWFILNMTKTHQTEQTPTSSLKNGWCYVLLPFCISGYRVLIGDSIYSCCSFAEPCLNISTNRHWDWSRQELDLIHSTLVLRHRHGSPPTHCLSRTLSSIHPVIFLRWKLWVISCIAEKPDITLRPEAIEMLQTDEALLWNCCSSQKRVENAGRVERTG